VGNCVLPIDAFRHDRPAAYAWQFASSPADQPGGAEIDEDDALSLSYDSAGTERVAYANTDVALDGDFLALNVDVQGDARAARSAHEPRRRPHSGHARAARTLNGFYLADYEQGRRGSGRFARKRRLSYAIYAAPLAGRSMRVPLYHVQAR
jgi:hypothetical protein